MGRAFPQRLRNETDDDGVAEPRQGKGEMDPSLPPDEGGRGYTTEDCTNSSSTPPVLAG